MSPVKGWTAAARVVDMHPDTLARHRKRCGDRTRVPWWPSEDAVRSWYQALIAPPPEPPKPARRRGPDVAIDPRKVARELAGGGR